MIWKKWQVGTPRSWQIKKGELLEMGSHEELLQRKGKYAELFRLQAMGYQ